jgi:hypothetical protein
MDEHNEKVCERCKQTFICKVNDIANCECNISLKASTRAYIAHHYHDCLCVNCLITLESQIDEL